MRSVGSGGRRRGRRDEDEDEVQMEDGKSLMPRTVIRLRERRKEGLRSKGRRQERRVSGSRNKKRKGKKTGARLRYPEFLQSQEKIGAKRAERFGTRGARPSLEYLGSSPNGGKFDPVENCPALTFSGSFLRLLSGRPRPEMALALTCALALANFTAARYSNPKMQNGEAGEEGKEEAAAALLFTCACTYRFPSLTQSDDENWGSGEQKMKWRAS